MKKKAKGATTKMTGGAGGGIGRIEKSAAAGKQGKVKLK